ncbi:hypothetical protein ACFS07_16655 [Undibacterium arcticum]
MPALSRRINQSFHLDLATSSSVMMGTFSVAVQEHENLVEINVVRLKTIALIALDTLVGSVVGKN